MSTLMSGYIDRGGAFVIPPKWRTANPFQSDVAVVKGYGAWDLSLINRKGDLLADNVVKIGTVSDGMRAFKVGELWGLAGKGRVVLTPSFEDIDDFGSGLVPIKRNERWGFVDLEGNPCIDCRFDEARAFPASDDASERLAPARKGDKWGFIDLQGRWQIQPTWENAWSFSGGYATVTVDGAHALIDGEGKVLSKGYERVDAMMSGMARVVRGEKLNFIGPRGKLLSKRWFAAAPHYGEGLATVQNDDDEWFFLLATGALVGPFTATFPATSGMARFVENGRVGFRGVDGEVLIEAKYEAAKGAREGLAPVRRDGVWTYVDASGAELDAPTWDAGHPFSEGLAVVVRDGKAGVIDRQGHVVVAPSFDTIAAFSEGLAPARRVSWPALERPPASWHVVPREGLAFEGFAAANEQDQLRATFAMPVAKLEDELSLKLQQIYGNWKELLDWQSDDTAVVPDSDWLSDYVLTTRIGGVRNPVAALALLGHELQEAGLPISDVAYARFRETRDPRLLVQEWEAQPHPADPGGPDHFATFEEYAERAFDLSQSPPASENAMELVAGRYIPNLGVVYAERTFTLHHPEVRICYGVRLENLVDGSTKRSKSVFAALEKALAARFDRERVWFFPPNRDPGVPVPRDQEGEPGLRRIEEEIGGTKRRGYAFWIESNALLQDAGPGSWRFREWELMEAVAQVVLEKELFPLIMWQRFGRPMPVPSHPELAHPREPNVYALTIWER